jgi:hypothetical protein
MLKRACALVLVALGLPASISSTSAQPYGYGRPYYGDREVEYERRQRGRWDRDEGAAFDEDEYLRCNPDVRRGVYRGQFESGFSHWRAYGRREGRRVSC